MVVYNRYKGNLFHDGVLRIQVRQRSGRSQERLTRNRRSSLSLSLYLYDLKNRVSLSTYYSLRSINLNRSLYTVRLQFVQFQSPERTPCCVQTISSVKKLVVVESFALQSSSYIRIYTYTHLSSPDKITRADNSLICSS